MPLASPWDCSPSVALSTSSVGVVPAVTLRERGMERERWSREGGTEKYKVRKGTRDQKAGLGMENNGNDREERTTTQLMSNGVKSQEVENIQGKGSAGLTLTIHFIRSLTI